MPAFVRYFRAGKLGEGTFGSVIAVYDAEGSEFAAKVFDDDEEEEDQVCETQSTFNCAAHLIRWLQEHALHLQRWSLKVCVEPVPWYKKPMHMDINCPILKYVIYVYPYLFNLSMLFISVLCCVCWDGLQEAEVDSDGDEIESEPMGGSGLQIDVLREVRVWTSMTHHYDASL